METYLIWFFFIMALSSFLFLSLIIKKIEIVNSNLLDY